MSSIIPLLEDVKFRGKTKHTKNKMGEEAESNLFGIFYDASISDWRLTRVAENNPELYLQLIQIGKLANPDFDFSGIMVNKNCCAKPHRDKNNVGTSIITGLGDYTGGNLCIVSDDNKIYEVDIKHSFVEFDGKSIHYNTPILSGTKWTLIYFKNCICAKNNIFININAYPTSKHNETQANDKIK